MNLVSSLKYSQIPSFLSLSLSHSLKLDFIFLSTFDKVLKKVNLHNYPIGLDDPFSIPSPASGLSLSLPRPPSLDHRHVTTSFLTASGRPRASITRAGSLL